MAHEGLRPSGWGKGEFPVKTWPPLNLLFLVLGNLDSCKQEGGVRLGSLRCTPTKVFLKVFTVVESLPTVATMAQAIQLAQGPIKRLAQVHRAQLGEKRCSSICLLVGISGKGLGM